MNYKLLVTGKQLIEQGEKDTVLKVTKWAGPPDQVKRKLIEVCGFSACQVDEIRKELVREGKLTMDLKLVDLSKA
ncbi:hypothetical protein [Tunicatimonas pelagia]|uniref:hypothetical protein n=1 Tax=Tunicatimonas pelagia TaxID=931531 RepID=UPI00266571B4|nr:hypothetical protein [Tunicatimonas pelagia]WKN46524.1 hypothetical protein P0M28_30915 [Tunicatimonas pelagia]